MTKQKELFGFNRSMIMHCILLFIGILSGLLFSNYLFIGVVAFTIVTSLVSQIDYTYYHLLFLLPFSTIFKLSPSSTSLFAYLMIATCLILLLRKKNFHGVPLVLIMSFIIYAIIGMGKNYTTVGKMCAGFILLYVFVTTVSPVNFKNHVLSFGLGMLGSSIIGTMKDSWGTLSAYFTNIDYVYVNGERSMRFSGLNYDPNYYSIAVILLVFLCIRMIFKKEGNRLFLGILTATMVIFGLISYSKMFLLSISIIALYFVFQKTKTVKQLVLTLFSITGIFGALSYWAIHTGYWNTIVNRLSGEDISTGRFAIWNRYIEYLRSSSLTILFGDGLGASYIGTAPHNTYIEMLFFMGVVGSALFIITLISIFNCKKTNVRKGLTNYVPFLLYGIVMSLLGCFTINDLMFHAMLLWISLNFDSSPALPLSENNQENNAVKNDSASSNYQLRKRV